MLLSFVVMVAAVAVVVVVVVVAIGDVVTSSNAKMKPHL